MSWLDDLGPRALARIAGGLYLVNILLGAFAIGYVSGQHAQAGDLLYRLGIAAHVIVTATNVPLALIFYDLFKVASRRAAALLALGSLVGTAIEAASLVVPSSVAPVPAYDVYSVFFAVYDLAIGYLIVASRLMPPVIGWLMLIDGAGYLVYGFADIVAPGFAAHLVPWIQLPILAGEGSLCVWLLARGIDVTRYGRLATAQSARAAELAG